MSRRIKNPATGRYVYRDADRGEYIRYAKKGKFKECDESVCAIHGRRCGLKGRCVDVDSWRSNIMDALDVTPPDTDDSSSDSDYVSRRKYRRRRRRSSRSTDPSSLIFPPYYTPPSGGPSGIRSVPPATQVLPSAPSAPPASQVLPPAPSAPPASQVLKTEEKKAQPSMFSRGISALTGFFKPSAPSEPSDDGPPPLEKVPKVKLEFEKNYGFALDDFGKAMSDSEWKAKSSQYLGKDSTGSDVVVSCETKEDCRIMKILLYSTDDEKQDVMSEVNSSKIASGSEISPQFIKMVNLAAEPVMNGVSYRAIGLITERYGPTLHKHLKKEFPKTKTISDDEMKTYFDHISTIISLILRNSWVHHDFTPKNVVVDINTGQMKVINLNYLTASTGVSNMDMGIQMLEKMANALVANDQNNPNMEKLGSYINRKAIDPATRKLFSTIPQ